MLDLLEALLLHVSLSAAPPVFMGSALSQTSALVIVAGLVEPVMMLSAAPPVFMGSALSQTSALVIVAGLVEPVMMTSTNVLHMEEWVNVLIYVPILQDHSSAVVVLGILYLDMPALTSTNVLLMEDWAHVLRYVPILQDHSSAVVVLGILYLDMPVMTLMSVPQPMEDVNKTATTQ